MKDQNCSGCQTKLSCAALPKPGQSFNERRRLENRQPAYINQQGHGVANDHAAFDQGDQARLPKFLRFRNISLHR